MPKEELSCRYCLRYKCKGADEHFQFCPTNAKDPKKAMEDWERGFKTYKEGTRLLDIAPEEADNQYFMNGYNFAFLMDGNVVSYPNLGSFSHQ